jgi:flagellin
MTAAAGTNRNGVDPVDVFSVTFSSLGANENVVVAGVTITAGGSGATAIEVAEALDSLADSGSPAAAGGVTSVSGTLTGFAPGDNSGSATVVFTATTAGTVSPTASGNGTITVVGGTGGTANNTAYGSGVLFYGSTPTRIDITSASNAAQAIAEIDRAIDGAAAERAKLGSFLSRLQHASDNLQNVATNTAASKSRVADADYATETTELARTQIISQASTAMLAQANQVKQTVLSLLQ